MSRATRHDMPNRRTSCSTSQSLQEGPPPPSVSFHSLLITPLSGSARNLHSLHLLLHCWASPVRLLYIWLPWTIHPLASRRDSTRKFKKQTMGSRIILTTFLLVETTSPTLSLHTSLTKVIIVGIRPLHGLLRKNAESFERLISTS